MRFPDDVDADVPVAGGNAIDFGGFRNLVHKHDLTRTVRIGFQITPDDDGLPQLGTITGSNEELDVDYRISLKDGLRVTRGAGSEKLELMMFEKDRLFGPFFKGEFRRDKQGRISGFVIDAGRVRGIGFTATN